MTTLLSARRVVPALVAVLLLAATGCESPTNDAPVVFSPHAPTGLAYTRYFGGTATLPGSQIVEVDTLGGNPKVLLSSNAEYFLDIEYSPSSDRLVFSHYAPRTVCSTQGNGCVVSYFQERYTNISILNLTNGQTIHITHTTQDNENFRFPAWSPDGRRIAFLRTVATATNTFSTSEVWIANSDGSGVRMLEANAGPGRPRWSPDGRVIAYGGPSEWAANGGILTLSVGSGARGVIKLPSGFSAQSLQPQCASSSSCLIGDLNWISQDELSFLAFGIDGLRVYLIDSSGSLRRSVPLRSVRLHRWSPDSTRIAVVTAAANPENGDIEVFRSDGTPTGVRIPPGNDRADVAWRN